MVRKLAWLVMAMIGMVAATGTPSGCGPGIPGGPTMNNKVGDDEPPPPAIQSNDVLARDAVTRTAEVKHILIGWKDLGEAYKGHLDARAAGRTRAQADELAVQLLGRVRAGEPIEPLMAEFSEDPGSNQSGEAYVITPDAQYVFEFKRMALRLNVDESGLVLTQFGWHVMKRVK